MCLALALVCDRELRFADEIREIEAGSAGLAIMTVSKAD